MKYFKIEYRLFSWDNNSIIVVSADSPAEAIKKAGLQNACECSISEYAPYKLGNKTYTRRYGTYNAVWLDEQGNAVYWGSYNPDDGSFYIAVPGNTLASGRWIERGDGDYEFQCHGTYSFNEVRRAIQLGVLI